MKYLMICWLAFAAWCGDCRAQDKPNIILIVSDDQGYNDLGAYGGKEIKTPYLDKLATEGVRLTNFYVTGSGCTPSRAGLLTGRYPQQNGTFELFRNDMVNYGHQYTAYEYSISPERILGTDLREVLISEPLKAAGYVNGYVGKWDLGQLKRFLPLQRGFDYFYGFANTGIDYYSHERYGIPSMYEGNTPTSRDKGIYTTDLFEQKALEFLEKSSDQPFFLYLAFNAPHTASNLDSAIYGTVQAPQAYLDLYAEGKSKAEERRRGYMAAVTCMDAAIGRIMQFVRQKGIEERTVVIFLSDNGGGGGADNTPLRGGKAQFFEGGIRVPCIIKWPGRIKPGSVNRRFLSSLELFPTLVNATGAALPDSVVYDGFDMLGVLQGNTDNERDHMFWEFRGEQAARMGHWKWVSSNSVGECLFDLSNDRSEKRNLIQTHPEIASGIRKKFADWKEAMDQAEPRGPFKDF